METFLNAVKDFALLEQGYGIELDWLGHFARIIIEGVGIIGVGIIVFALVLKAITLPFDIYQRVKMRKQTLIMRNMKPELEKLQKQYANDKAMYSTKMSELYKKNGYSLFGACLPMILSIVILIVAFQGFRTYSYYANIRMFERMSACYNEAVLENGVDGVDFTLQKEADSSFTVTDGAYTLVWAENGETKTAPLTWETDGVLSLASVGAADDGLVYTMRDPAGDGEARYLEVSSSDPAKFLLYHYNLGTARYDEETKTARVNREYQYDEEALRTYLEARVAEQDGAETPEREALSKIEAGDTAAYRAYIVKRGATAARDWYREHDASFLWVRNVWYPDVSYNHPIPEKASDFGGEILNNVVTLSSGDKVSFNSVISKNYDDLTSELGEEKAQANGYFILIVLSIGFMVLSQFLTMRSQKESNEFQTVDGSGARTQKIMLVIMPLIYAIFAFLYTAAFTIYMIMSSVLSTLVTLLANFIIGRIFRKKEEEAFRAEHERKLPWMDKNKKGKK